MINQELDLVFVGTKHCIFDDKTLSNLHNSISEPIQQITTPHSAKLVIYEDVKENPLDYYLIGCDTAQSLTGAYCAIQVFSFKTFNQIAEMQYRFGSYTAFGQVIDFVFQYFYKLIGNRIILCIENNTIGTAPIEYLRYHTKDFSYEPFLYKEDKEKDEYGVKTTGLSKPLMVGCLMEALEENTNGIKSSQLVNQFGSMEKTATGSIKSTGYSDLFMASCFCSYVRKKEALSIMPLIEFTPKQIETSYVKKVKAITSIMSVKPALIQNDSNSFNEPFILGDPYGQPANVDGFPGGVSNNPFHILGGLSELMGNSELDRDQDDFSGGFFHNFTG